MSEQPPSAETPQYSRERVIDAFKPLLGRGFTNPDDLPLADPEVSQANQLLDNWTKQQETAAQKTGTTEADLKFALDRSTLLIDAGFSDPDYLDEVAHDWLAHDLERAQSAGLDGLARQIGAKIQQIEEKIPNE